MGESWPGRFNDGRTAASRAVSLRWSEAGLDIRDGDGLLIAFWRRQDIRADGQAAGPQGARLRCAAEPDARLTIPDSLWLRTIAPALSARPRERRAGLRTLAAVLAGLAALGGLVAALPAASRQVAFLVPPAVERQWGGHLATSLEGRWGACSAPAGDAALRLLEARLAAGLPEEARPSRVAVVRVEAENAVALPGGAVYIFKGLLDRAQGPDEVAGVLAHEMTHIAERHPTAAMIRGFGVGLLVTMVTGDASGLLAAGAATVLSGAYSRDDEAAADRGAARLLARAGIGTGGLAGFFRRLAGSGDGVIPDWLSTHPDPQARARALEQAGHGTPATPALSPEHWAALKGICG